MDNPWEGIWPCGLRIIPGRGYGLVVCGYSLRENMALWSVDNPWEGVSPCGLWIIPENGYGLVVCG